MLKTRPAPDALKKPLKLRETFPSDHDPNRRWSWKFFLPEVAEQ